MINFVAFSRNRPIQLHALLSSMRNCVDGPHSVTVLHRYDSEYQASLDELVQEFHEVRFVNETSFRDQVTKITSESGYFIAFLVDDIIFKEKFSVDVPVSVLNQVGDSLCFSLRLGLHLDYCYPVDRPMKVPDGTVSNGVFFWDWTSAELDWNYPLSLDGHVFRRDQMLQMISAIQFKNPNEFEAVLQFIAKQYQLPRICSSFVRSPLLNVPMNRVQDEFKNRCLDVTVESLHDLWRAGNVIDLTRLDGYINHGAHEPIELSYMRRN